MGCSSSTFLHRYTFFPPSHPGRLGCKKLHSTVKAGRDRGQNWRKFQDQTHYSRGSVPLDYRSPMDWATCCVMRPLTECVLGLKPNLMMLLPTMTLLIGSWHHFWCIPTDHSKKGLPVQNGLRTTFSNFHPKKPSAFWRPLKHPIKV